MIVEIILGILLITETYVVWNLMRKQEMLEGWVENFITTIEKIDQDLKNIDYRGSFKTDDEVGTIFEEIKNTLKQLDQFKEE
tara:strand:- start:2345 stop:2590 length:246 start_codon:yes stop_codon:yes gene_type:complete